MLSYLLSLSPPHESGASNLLLLVRQRVKRTDWSSTLVVILTFEDEPNSTRVRNDLLPLEQRWIHKVREQLI